jgi:chromosome segregation ATPase
LSLIESANNSVSTECNIDLNRVVEEIKESYEKQKQELVEKIKNAEALFEKGRKMNDELSGERDQVKQSLSEAKNIIISLRDENNCLVLEINRLTDSVKRLNDDTKELKIQGKALENENKSLSKKLSAIEQKALDLANENEKLHCQLDRKDGECKQQFKQLASLSNNLGSSRQETSDLDKKVKNLEQKVSFMAIILYTSF